MDTREGPPEGPLSVAFFPHCDQGSNVEGKNTATPFEYNNEQYLSMAEDGAWRRGKRPGSKDWGLMFESCLGCDTADLFHFGAYNEGPPWGPTMSL